MITARELGSAELPFYACALNYIDMSPLFIKTAFSIIAVCLLLIAGYYVYEWLFLKKAKMAKPQKLADQNHALQLIADILYGTFLFFRWIENLWEAVKRMKFRADAFCPTCGHRNVHGPCCIHRRDEGWIETEMLDENSYS